MKAKTVVSWILAAQNARKKKHPLKDEQFTMDISLDARTTFILFFH